MSLRITARVAQGRRLYYHDAMVFLSRLSRSRPLPAWELLI
jgi:hypothetical protein